MTEFANTNNKLLSDFINHFKNKMTTQRKSTANTSNLIYIQLKAEVNQHEMQTQAEQWNIVENVLSLEKEAIDSPLKVLCTALHANTANKE